GLSLELVLTLPALTLIGSLSRPGVGVVQMLTAAGIGTGGVPAELTVSAVDFAADGDAKTYSADVAVDGVWASGPLQLKQIAASISYLAGAWSGSFAVQL